MRKFFLSALLFVAAMSSCSENEVDVSTSLNGDGTISDPDLISLNVAAAGTRGADTTTATLEAGAITAEKGIDLHLEDSGKDDTYTKGVYNFTANGSDWSQSSTTLYWEDIDFPVYFYSMHDGAPQSLSHSKGSATLAYSVAGESSGHKDLVYHASTLNSIPMAGTVNAYHQHALSKVNLLAGTGTNKVYIAKATLMNVDGEGTATISTDGVKWDNGDSNEADYKYYFIDGSAPQELQSSTEDNVTTNPRINSDDKAPLMIIPQSVIDATVEKSADGTTSTVSGTYIELIYYLTDSNDASLVGYSKVSVRTDADDYIDGDQDKTLYVKAAFPFPKESEFVDNKQYNIILGLGMDKSTGGLLVDDFYVDQNGDPVTLTKKGCTEGKEEIPEIEPGDEILGGSDDLVDIMVDVKSWGDSSLVNLY